MEVKKIPYNPERDDELRFQRYSFDRKLGADYRVHRTPVQATSMSEMVSLARHIRLLLAKRKDTL